MLDLLGLGRRAHLRADRLSGGEKQRVAVGRALLKPPRFCFADEPTGSLDWAHGEQVIRLLHSAAHDRGAVLFVVGHDPRLVPLRRSRPAPGRRPTGRRSPHPRPGEVSS